MQKDSFLSVRTSSIFVGILEQRAISFLRFPNCKSSPELFLQATDARGKARDARG